MAKVENRSKFAYLSYEDMLLKLENGVLDAYDIIFDKNNHNQYIISPDLKPISIQSRVYVYSSVSEAISELNQNTDTYAGQIVSIEDSENQTYHGYIVTYNSGLRVFSVKPLYSNPDGVNFDELINAPIVNIEGQMSEKIQLAELEDGTYNVKGWSILPDDESVVKYKGFTAIVETIGSTKYVKTIMSDSVVDYMIVDGVVTKHIYATDAYISNLNYISKEELEALNYATKEYVDEKVEELKDLINVTVQIEVEKTVKEEVSDIVDQKVEEKIETDLTECEDEDINGLF